MSLKLATDDRAVTVYVKEKETQNGGKFNTYSLGVASKDKDDNWVNGFVDCQFRKADSGKIVHKCKIKITNSFPTVRKWTNRDGKEQTSVSWMIMGFEVVEMPQGTNVPAQNTDFMTIPDSMSDELPFV